MWLPTWLRKKKSNTVYASSDYISFNKRALPELVAEYVVSMELQRTDKWCRCEWIVHPDDSVLSKGRRVRRGEPAFDCPIHTKEGFLLYFIEWARQHE